MKKIYLLLFVLTLQFSYSQDLIIGNQAQLNAISPLPTTVNGNLTIISDGSNDIYDLSKLANLVTITGNLTISNNPILSNLDGLSALTTITGGTITIQNNLILYSFCGLSKVVAPITATISGNSYNPTYADITNPATCKAADNVYTGNLTLTTQASIDALPQYTKIVGGLVIGNTTPTDITSLSKFSKLREITGRLLIQDSPSLTNLTGLNALEAIATDALITNRELVIRRMNGLTSIQGLLALRTVGRRMGIWSNAVLTSLDGLNNLKLIKDNVTSELIRIGLKPTTGDGNPLLTNFCALKGIIDIIGPAVLDADPLSYIDNETPFNPTFTQISNGTCQAPLAVGNFDKGSYKIYPNPVSNVLNIKSDEVLDSVRIINSLGMELINTKATVIDMSTFSTGVYFIEIKSGSKSAVEKIIKK